MLRAAREPLVHFLAIGLVIFLGAAVVKSAQKPVVRLDEKELSQLAAYWQTQMQRAPTKAELAGIIRDRVDEELLAREAVRLGLDRNDMIVRRRLAEKMAFAGEDTAPIPEPTEPQLRAFFDQTKTRYIAPAHMALTHVYFSGDRATSAAKTLADRALRDAQHGATDLHGQPFALPSTYGDVNLEDLNRDYGSAFAQAAARAPLGQWIGPVQSAYGWHILRVTVRHAAQAPAFAEVRSEVRDAWIAEQRRQANSAFLAKLRARYRVEVAGSAP